MLVNTETRHCFHKVAEIIFYNALYSIAQCQQTAENWFDKGTALSNQGKYDEAIKAYDAAIKLDPNYAAAWNDRGIALDESGKYEEAIQAYNQTTSAHPRSRAAGYARRRRIKTRQQVS